MIIQPRTRGFICLTAHPDGALQAVKNQIEYVKSKGKIKNGPKKVLVIIGNNLKVRKGVKLSKEKQKLSLLTDKKI